MAVNSYEERNERFDSKYSEINQRWNELVAFRKEVLSSNPTKQQPTTLGSLQGWKKSWISVIKENWLTFGGMFKAMKLVVKHYRCL